MFIQEGGERSIVMAPAATSLLNQETVTSNFGKKHTHILSHSHTHTYTHTYTHTHSSVPTMHMPGPFPCFQYSMLKQSESLKMKACKAYYYDSYINIVVGQA